MRHLIDPGKSQAEHYSELLIERKDNPCTPDQQTGRNTGRERNHQ
jgi:hypothetical protein